MNERILLKRFIFFSLQLTSFDPNWSWTNITKDLSFQHGWALSKFHNEFDLKVKQITDRYSQTRWCLWISNRVEVIRRRAQTTEDRWTKYKRNTAQQEPGDKSREGYKASKQKENWKSNKVRYSSVIHFQRNDKMLMESKLFCLHFSLLCRWSDALLKGHHGEAAAMRKNYHYSIYLRSKRRKF